MRSYQVEKLNDERNWRKGLRVRLLLRCSVDFYILFLSHTFLSRRSEINFVDILCVLQPKSVLKNRRNFDGILIDDELPSYESGEDSPRLHLTESQLDNDVSTVA